VLVFAHGIVGRADLPIPGVMFGVAASLVLVLSFVALATLWSRPRLQEPRERRLFRLPVAVDVVLGALGVLVFGVTAYAGLAGTELQRDNLAPTMVYVGFWVGVPFASLLFGDVWRLLSPWRALGRAAGWIAGGASGGGDLPPPLAYPERLGRWPAFAGLLGFGICELAWGAAKDPTTLAVLMLAYFVVMLVGMSLYGVEAWTRNGDAFGVYFGLFAALAPLARRAGTLVARLPAVGAVLIDTRPGTTAVLLGGIGITAFDGAAEGPLFNDALPHLQDFFSSLGFQLSTALELGFVVGLFVTVAVIGLIWWVAVRGMPPTGEPPRRPGRAMAHSLVPILAAYVVAHYFSLLAYNGQDLWRLASDPLGHGSDLFGGAGAAINYGVVSATAIWYVQVAALVIGHVTGLVLAHDRALALYGSHRGATRSQVVMLVVMVCFTCLGLWLLSVANA
jgi:hypothetical protein